MKFLHLPTNTVIEAQGPALRRYRRSSNFLPLSPTEPPDSDEDAPDSLASPPHDLDTTEVPEGNVSEVLQWADTDPQRRQAALTHERANKQRVTLIRALESDT